MYLDLVDFVDLGLCNIVPLWAPPSWRGRRYGRVEAVEAPTQSGPPSPAEPSTTERRHERTSSPGADKRASDRASEVHVRLAETSKKKALTQCLSIFDISIFVRSTTICSTIKIVDYTTLHQPLHHPKLDGRATVRANLHVGRAALARELMAARHRKVRLGPHHAHDARGLATDGRFGRLVVHTAGDVAHIGERQRPLRWHQTFSRCWGRWWRRGRGQ